MRELAGIEAVVRDLLRQFALAHVGTRLRAGSHLEVHRMRKLSLLSLLCWLAVGCSESSDLAPDASKTFVVETDATPDADATSCELEPQVASIAGATAIDCGSLAIGADVAMRERAQRCVLEAQEGKHAYKLIVQVQGIDSSVSQGYASPGGAGFASALSYDSDPSGGSRLGALITEQSCRSLQRVPACQPSETTICLECLQTVESSIVCHGRSAGDACRGRGNYEAGKEGSYLPCCAGLREVFQQRASYRSEDNQRVCDQPPLRVYACIEGRCGDDRCEDAEAVPCGCSLDCPTAIVSELDGGTIPP